MKKILITGADGFIGKALCEKFSEEGFYVIALVLNKNNVAHTGKMPGIKIIEADITKKGLVEKIAEDFDFCIHLAGISDVNIAEENPLLTRKVNVLGTKNILQACAKLKCKGIIFASTNKVYGKIKKTAHEKSMLNGKTIYAKTKIRAEKEVRDFCKKNGLSAIIARQTNIYGRADLNIKRLIPATILSAIRNEQPKITSSPLSEINLLYVDDILDFYSKSIKYMEKHSRIETLNVTSDNNYLVTGIMQLIMQMIGKCNAEKASMGKKIASISNKKAKKLLKWRPKTSLKKGLKKTIAWYKANYKDVCTKPINN
ncbi:MAG: NAD(P)-dependent oxidoreductase [archaeon]